MFNLLHVCSQRAMFCSRAVVNLLCCVTENIKTPTFQAMTSADFLLEFYVFNKCVGQKFYHSLRTCHLNIQESGISMVKR